MQVPVELLENAGALSHFRFEMDGFTRLISDEAQVLDERAFSGEVKPSGQQVAELIGLQQALDLQPEETARVTAVILGAVREIQEAEVRTCVFLEDTPTRVAIDISPSRDEARHIVERFKEDLNRVLPDARGVLLSNYIDPSQFQGVGKEASPTEVVFTAALRSDEQLTGRISVSTGGSTYSMDSSYAVPTDGAVGASGFPDRWRHLLGARLISPAHEDGEE